MPAQFAYLLFFLNVISYTAYSQTGLHFLSRWDYSKSKPLPSGQKYSELRGWAAPDGKEYSILGGVDSIYFIEVTDPLHPVLRAKQAGKDSGCTNRDVKTSGHYAYLVADEGNSSLQIFDLQYLPDSVHKVYDSDSIIFRAHTLTIEYPWLYINWPKTKTGPFSFGFGAMKVLSITNPEKPELVYSMPNNKNFEYVHDMYLRHDTAYMSCGNDGLWIYDFTDHTGPVLVKAINIYPDQGFNHSSCLSADSKTLIFTDENKGLRIKRYDVSRLKNANIIDRNPVFDTMFSMPSYKIGSIAHNSFIKGRYAYVSYYEDGVAVFDMQDSNRLVGHYDTYPQNDSGVYSGFQGCWGVYPYLPSGTIIASDMKNGLFCMRFDSGTTGIAAQLSLQNRISIFPNPARTEITIKVSTDKHEDIKFELYSSLGEKVLEETKIKEIIGAYNMNLESLPDGIYILKASTNTESITYKIIKQ